MNMVVCRRYDQKVVERSGYDRADGCNALMPRLCGEDSGRCAKGNEDSVVTTKAKFFSISCNKLCKIM
jgi:hypothetical protein